MNTIIPLAISSLFLSLSGNDGVIDLQGATYIIPNGDVSVFNGREIKNGKIVVSEGDYPLQVNEEGGACLIVGDNMEVVIDGNLCLDPNNYKSYDMILVVGSNVKINGKGSIIGDKFTHYGNNGEWGMGIRLNGAENVTVSDITVADCWGDCIYIGGNCKDIKIYYCLLHGSRRQGISITKADGVTISNCTIENISGTNPQYAIDIEPNKRCTVDNVLIENVTVNECEGGFRAIIGKEEYGNARIGKVEILNCNIMAKTRHTIQFAGCEQAVVKDCVIETRRGEKPILSRKVGKLSKKNNKVIYK